MVLSYLSTRFHRVRNFYEYYRRVFFGIFFPETFITSFPITTRRCRLWRSILYRLSYAVHHNNAAINVFEKLVLCRRVENNVNALATSMLLKQVNAFGRECFIFTVQVRFDLLVVFNSKRTKFVWIYYWPVPSLPSLDRFPCTLRIHCLVLSRWLRIRFDQEIQPGFLEGRSKGRGPLKLRFI